MNGGEAERTEAHARITKLENERNALRTIISDLLTEVTKTRQWRECRGMKPATDTSELASVPESALQAIERWFRNV